MPKSTIITLLIVLILVAAGIWYFVSYDLVEPVQKNENVNVNINTNTNTNSPANSNTNATISEPGLVAHWAFDEGSGDAVTDSVNNYSGEINGNAGWVDGQSGGALGFDGSDDHVIFSEDALNAIGSLQQGTIAFWFKYVSQLDVQPIMPIFHVGTDSTDDQDNMFIVEIGHGGTESTGAPLNADNKKLYVTWVKDNQEPVLCFDSNANLEEDTWYHFAAVVGPDGNTGYLNGVEMTNRDYNFGQSSDKLFLNDIPQKELFTLGYGKTNYHVSSYFGFFQGAIDDLRIYSRALSSTEIAGLVD